MHELGLARNIAAIVGEHARGRPVAVVRVAIGPLACVERRALAFCWDIVAEAAGLAGAALEIVPAEGDVLVVRDYTIREDA
jgi:hydrogenase nickel incorporation protein HypA/HybF